MERKQAATLSLKAAYQFGIEMGLEEESDSIRNMVIEWDRSYSSSLRRGYIISLFEDKGIFEEFKNLHWSNGNTRSGLSMRRRFLRIKDDYEDFLSGEESGEDEDSIDTYQEQAFAAEADLRDFLAENLELIEQGLRVFDDEGRPGIEYPVDGGRIDLLALDSSGKFVVIELKISRGRKKTVGQLLYYMAWVDEHLGKRSCRGIIVAREIPPDLRLTVQKVPSISLFEYSLRVDLNQIE